MYPDSPFARPVSSFRRPAPVINIDPDAKPDKTVCFRSEWTPYIVGALRQLLLQTTWATDDPVALNLMQARAQLLIALFMEGCPPEKPIVTKVFIEESEYEMSLCEQLKFVDGKLQAMCCGEWVDVAGQHSDGLNRSVEQAASTTGPLAPGVCADYPISLDAGQRYLLPVPVNAGDVITITDVSGAWNDGTLLWFCPMGFTYALGLCASLEPAMSGDPLQTVGHMRLIAGLNPTTPIYMDAFNSTIVVPSGVTNEQMWFQANDSALPGNSGRISFHLNVCSSEASANDGSDIFDFTAGNQGWTIRSGHAGSYVAATGFEAGCDQPGLDTYKQIIVQKTVVNAGRITGVIASFDRVYAGYNDGATGAYAAKNFSDGGGGIAIGSSSSMASGTGTVEHFVANPVDVVPGDVITVAVVAGYLHARGDCSSLASGSVVLPAIIVNWVGTDPF